MTDEPWSDPPPHDLAAEASVLGAVLISPAAMDDVSTLTPGDFYAPKHQTIWSTALDLHLAGRPVDAVTVAAALGPELARVGGGAYLHTLTAGVPSARAAATYARIVAEKATARRILAAGEKITALARSGVEGLEDAADTAIRDALSTTAGSGPRPIAELIDPLLDSLDDGEVPGITTGFVALDEILLPLTPGRLVVIAGRPGAGKSTMGLDIARHASTHGTRTVFASAEMAAPEITQRWISAEARIPLDALQRRRLSDGDWQSIARARDKIAEVDLLIDDAASHSLATLNATVRRHKPGLLVVDYLQLLTPPDHRVPREQQVAALSRGLKLLAKAHGIPVILMSQLNRAVESRHDKRPGLSDLRESGAIEQDADVVILLHRPDAYDWQDRPGEVDAIVAKQRNGPTGTRTLAAQLHYARIVDLERWQS